MTRWKVLYFVLLVSVATMMEKVTGTGDKVKCGNCEKEVEISDYQKYDQCQHGSCKECIEDSIVSHLEDDAILNVFNVKKSYQNKILLIYCKIYHLIWLIHQQILL